jgi:hypothetical protein
LKAAAAGVGALAAGRGAPAFGQICEQPWPPVEYISQPVGSLLRPDYLRRNLEAPADLWPGQRGTAGTIDVAHDSLFTRNGPGWAGSDTMYTVMLSDGQVVWITNDAIVYASGATPTSNTSRPFGTLVHNAFALPRRRADGAYDLLATISRPDRSMTAIAPVSPPPYRPLVGQDPRDGYARNCRPPQSVYTWLMHGAASGDNLYVLAWDFDRATNQFLGTRITAFTQRYLLPNGESNRLPGPIGWGSWVGFDLVWGYWFVYGVDLVTSQPGPRPTYVARTQDLSRFDAWEFFDGTTWQRNCPGLAHPMVMEGTTSSPHVSNQFSVVCLGTFHYVYISQDTWLGRDVWALASTTPHGPWRNPVKLFSTASWKPYPATPGTINLWKPFTYNTLAHVDLSVDSAFRRNPAGVLFSYCRNAWKVGAQDKTLKGWPLLFDPDAYRPYFVRIPWGNFPTP